MGWHSLFIRLLLGLSVVGTAFAITEGDDCSVALLDETPETVEGLADNSPAAPFSVTSEDRRELRVIEGMMAAFPHARFRGRGGQNLVFTVPGAGGDVIALRVPRNPSSERAGRMRRTYLGEKIISDEVNRNVERPVVVSALAVATYRHLSVRESDRAIHPAHERKVPILVSSWVDGRDISKDITQLGANADPRVLLDAMIKIALLVREVHAKGWVHADIKPGNILIEGFDPIGFNSQYVLLDLGYACRLNDYPPGWDMSRGTVFGTQGFMSPNRRRGGTAQFSDDLFSLVRTFALMLVGSLDLTMRDSRDPKDEASFQMPVEPYSLMDPLEGEKAAAFQTLSKVIHHPWKDIDSLIESLRSAKIN